MFTLAVRTGLRIGELRALRWDDVDLVAGRLVVRRTVWRGHVGTPKSGRNREMPLSDDALKGLKSQRHLRAELVFCAEGGRELQENECKWPLWRACKRASLRRVGSHALRHYPDRRIIPHRHTACASPPSVRGFWPMLDAG